MTVPRLCPCASRAEMDLEPSMARRLGSPGQRQRRVFDNYLLVNCGFGAYQRRAGTKRRWLKFFVNK
jgi:hypothetical protein